MKNKIFSLISLVVLTPLLVPYFTFGQGDITQFGTPTVTTSVFGCTESDTFTTCAAKLGMTVLKFVMLLAVIFAAVMIAIGGIQYITGGEKGKDAAKNRIIYAAIGLVVALISYALVMLLKGMAAKGL